MGDQEFETQRGFLHKDPNNGSQDIFFLTLFLLYALYFLSRTFFLPSPSTFPLLEGGGVGLFNEAGNFDFSGSRLLQEANNQSYSNFFLSVFSLYLLDGTLLEIRVLKGFSLKD